MARVSQTMTLKDEVSPVLKSIIKSMDATVKAMKAMDTATSSGGSSTAWDSVKEAIDDANDALGTFEKHQNQVGRGSQQVEKHLLSWGDAIFIANQGLQLLQQMQNMLGAPIQWADEMTALNARLDLVNDGLQTSEELQQKIYNSAQRSRAAYSETAKSVAQLNMLAGDAFGSNDEAIAFMELLNKSFVVAGTGSQEAAAGMQQLTQALASGRLQGDEYNSILENAPMIANAIKNYMGVTLGEMREMSSEGAITTDIIKNAVFAAAGDIEAKFQEMPLTFDQSMTRIKNSAAMMAQPLVQMFNNVVNSTTFEQASLAAVDAIQQIVNALSILGAGIGAVGGFVAQNWDIIGPILTAAVIALGLLTAAYVAYRTALAVGAGVETASAVAKIAYIALTQGQTAATTAATAAQLGLNAALLANPITWVVVLIALLIAALVAVGLKLHDLWETNIDFRVGVLSIWNSILNFFDQVPIFFTRVGNGIVDAFDWANLKVAEIFEGMVNFVIDGINELIGLVNKVPGVAIDPLQHISLAAQQAALNAANKANRDANLANMELTAARKQENRARTLGRQVEQWRSEMADSGAADAANPWLSGAGAAGYGDYSQFQSDMPKLTATGGSLNTNVTGGSLETTISDEDLKYLRDLADIQYVNKYTTLRPVVQATFGDVHETADVDSIVERFEQVISDAYEGSLDRVG